jgi:hypothetical protein
MDTIDHALALCIATNTPAMIWGLPGIGKTAMVEAIGASLDRPVHTILGSLYEASDLVGLPVRDGDRVRTMPRDWVLECLARPNTILFLDELTTVDPNVQGAMLRIINERVVGDVRLPESISVLCAANPPESAAAGVDLSPPMANRLLHLYHEASARTFSQGIRNGWMTSPSLNVPTSFDNERAAWAEILATFIERKPSLLHVLPSLGADQGGPWPSPRSWEMAITVLAASDAAKASKSTQFHLLKGAVGEGAATEFLTFAKHANLLDPEALLRCPQLFNPSTASDQLLEIIRNLERCLTVELTKQRWDAAWILVERFVDATMEDLAAMFAQALLRLGGSKYLPPESIKVFARTFEHLSTE